MARRTHQEDEEPSGEGAWPETEADASGFDVEGDEVHARTKGGLWPADRLKPVLEALIFAAADPVAVRRVCQVVSGATKPEVVAALAELQRDCEQRGVRLVEVAGGWQYRTAPEHHQTIKKLFKERPYRLSRAGIETLAVVAYRQPATRAEVESIRGVDVTGVLEGLVERRLVRIAGRRDVAGRPLVYETTGEFLEVFGLKDLSALPTMAELGDEILSMADRAGIDHNDERDAPILPLEEGDSGDEITVAGHDDPDAHESSTEEDRDHAGDRAIGQAGEPKQAGKSDEPGQADAQDRGGRGDPDEQAHQTQERGAAGQERRQG